MTVEKTTKEKPDRPLTPSEIKKIEAEAEAALADAKLKIADAGLRMAETELKSMEALKTAEEKREATAKADYAEAIARAQAIALEQTELARVRTIAADEYDDTTFRFLQPVQESSVQACIKQLDAWHRGKPKCGMTIIFDSPGGDVIAGMHLFDHLRELSDKYGHHITTVTRGYAASMAGILLQAGDTRVMGPEAYLLIHEVAFTVRGKFGEVEDEMNFVKMIQNRVLDIFARRCQGASKKTATKALTKAQLKAKWSRRDWWMDSKSALEYGLVDEVR